MKATIVLFLILYSVGCQEPYSTKENKMLAEQTSAELTTDDTLADMVTPMAAPVLAPVKDNTIQTGNTTPEALLNFARTLQGIPYKYASTNPAEGFDCSGFITYVFNHFNINVPRSSVDFTHIQRPITLAQALPGDIILFTGTDSTIRVIGHMGIITENTNGSMAFIHSTSGKADGVTITPLNDYYMGRFVKVIRIFKQNDEL